jgi:miniconductance mechanosensitive channel
MPDEVVHLDPLKLLNQANEPANINRIITNIELFRLYIEDYLRNMSYIRKDELLVVYQHSPTPQGIPVEIFAYTTLTNFAEFQHLQSRIIAHAIIKMREFGLVAFQSSSLS